jgi:GT2 family glycosyltransferase
MNKLTKAVDPVKVYEYLSQGKPVVSSPLPELEPMSGLLYFADTAEAFADQIDRALAEPREALERQRIEFARANTWTSRFAVLDEAIRARFPLVSILVVTYNTKEYLAPFFEALRRNTSYPSWEIVVVDNHSSDGSAEELRRLAGGDPRVKLDLLEGNLGFAGGNNHAARMAGGEYLLLLNPDTIVTAGWIERLLRALEKEPAAGVAAPVSNFSGNETKINTSYRTIDEMEDFAESLARKRRGQSIEIGVVPLFCGLLRRALWDETGGLDDGFEIGMFEDDDFSQRVRKAGHRIVTAEDCFIHHFGNGSFAKLDPAESNRLFDKNRKRYESKWNTWTPHKTRDGVRPVSADSRVTLAEFFGEGHEVA